MKEKCLTLFSLLQQNLLLKSSDLMREMQLLKRSKGVWYAKKNIKKMERKMAAINAVLNDAEQKQYTNEAIKLWLRDLKKIVYAIEDLLDEAATDALQRSVNKGHLLRQARYYLSSNSPLFFRFELSRKIKDLCERLAELEANKNTFGLTEHPVERQPIERNPLDTFPYVKVPDIIGRDEAKSDIISRQACLRVNENGLIVLAIVGFGGLGKTALAKLLFNDEWVGSNFDLKLWATVSHEFDLRKTLEAIIKSFADVDNTQHLDIGQLSRKLHDMINGRRYFLVLDDVWIEDINVWRDQLESILAVGNEGSVIVITTRGENVASNITPNVYHLNSLPQDVCWSIFKHIAFKEDEEDKYPNLYCIGESIVQKCGGVPLVVKTIAGFLRDQRDEREWRRIQELDSFLKLDERYEGIMLALTLSYEKLPYHLKACFAFFSLVGKGIEPHATGMFYYWGALGLMRSLDKNFEVVGEQCIKELLSRCFIQDLVFAFNNTTFCFKIHDLLHDLAMKITGEELAVVTANDMKKISESTRHISWGLEYFDGLSNCGFPKELIKAKEVRSLRFNFKIGHVSKSFLEGIISNFKCLPILDFQGITFEELPRSVGNLKHLRYLDISFNPLIKVLPSTVCKLVNLQALLTSCEQLEELPRDMDNLISLR